MDSELIRKNSQTVSEILKVLSHPQRLCILCLLSEGRKTVGELQEQCELSQSHVSQFLSKMKLQDLLISTREGNFVYYEIKDKKVIKLLDSLHSIYCDSSLD